MGDDAAIQSLDAMLKNGKWTFTFWHGSRCFGIYHSPAEVLAAEIKPVTHLRTSVEFTVSWTPNPISFGRMMNARRWLKERQQLIAIGEKHENSVYQAWYCSLFDKEAAHVG